MSRVTPYVKTDWEDTPSTSSPINSVHLNHLETGVKNVTDAVNELVVELEPATESKLGGIKVGENLSIEQDGTLSANAQQYTLPAATQNTLGGIKVGTNLSISQDGTLSADAQQYTLPPATQNTLGGIKVGENLSIEEDGTLSATGSSIESMTYEETINVLDEQSYTKINLFQTARTIDAYGPWNPSPQLLTINEDGLITFSPTGIADVPGITLATVIDLDGFTIPIGSKLVFSGKGGEDLYFEYQNQKIELVDGKTTISINCSNGRLYLRINVTNGKTYDISCVPEVWIPQT